MSDPFSTGSDNKRPRQTLPRLRPSKHPGTGREGVRTLTKNSCQNSESLAWQPQLQNQWLVSKYNRTASKDSHRSGWDISSWAKGTKLCARGLDIAGRNRDKPRDFSTSTDNLQWHWCIARGLPKYWISVCKTLPQTISQSTADGIRATWDFGVPPLESWGPVLTDNLWTVSWWARKTRLCLHEDW